MNDNLTWGQYIARKRRIIKQTIRELAASINISSVYLNEMENGKKTNPSKEIMSKMIIALRLNADETALFYDLQAKANNEVSRDLIEYIMGNENVRTIIRMARDRLVSDRYWQDFISKLK